MMTMMITIVVVPIIMAGMLISQVNIINRSSTKIIKGHACHTKYISC